MGVQSFDNGLLKQMDRYDKYGSGEEILERIREASPYFTSLNADMIFNFPAQTEDILISDIERVVESGASQTTFYPLMASPSVARSLARTVGKVDYSRERLFYQIIDELLAGGSDPLFDHGSAWTFNRVPLACQSAEPADAAGAPGGALGAPSPRRVPKHAILPGKAVQDAPARAHRRESNMPEGMFDHANRTRQRRPR